MNYKDLEKLGEAFSYYREEEFNSDYYCDSICEKTTCDCCGNYVDCGNSQSDCSRIEKAIEEHKQIVKESFYLQTIYELNMAIQNEHIFALVDQPVDMPVDIEHFNKVFNTHFKEIKKEELIINKEEIPKCYEIPEKNHLYLKRVIDSSLKLINNPKIYFGFELPLVIIGNNYLIIIAPKIEEED